MLEEPPRHVRILLRERPEVPELDRVAAHRRHRLHGGGALAFAGHRELAEVVARPHRAHPRAVDDDGGLALGDHEEGDAAHVTLLGEQHAGGNATVLEVLGELAQLALAEAAEQRDPLQVLGYARHDATLPEACPWVARCDKRVQTPNPRGHRHVEGVRAHAAATVLSGCGVVAGRGGLRRRAVWRMGGRAQGASTRRAVPVAPGNLAPPAPAL